MGRYCTIACAGKAGGGRLRGLLSAKVQQTQARQITPCNNRNRYAALVDIYLVYKENESL